MNERVNELQHLLCEQWCADASIEEDQGGVRVSLPLAESDGDAVTVWIQSELGGWRITDQGTTLMRLSYSMDDVDVLHEGQRAKVVERIVLEQGVQFVEGELYTHAEEGELGGSLFRLGVAMSRLGDLKLWSWHRISSTFYEDLARELERAAGAGNVTRDYMVPELPEAQNYLVDFSIKTAGTPFYVFGVPNREKARLATIILQHLQNSRHVFDSLIVPQDFEGIPKADRNRLLNAANDIVTGIDAVDVIRRKVQHRLTATG